jgi:hypothetical protein
MPYRREEPNGIYLSENFSVDTFFIKNYDEIKISFDTNNECVIGEVIPHFFYHSLFFIENLLLLNDHDSVMSPCRYQWRHSTMLWVEINLRRESSIVWCEEGFNALFIHSSSSI